MASDSDSDIDKILIFAYFHTHQRTLRQRRAIWIHDTIGKLRQLGEYHRLVNELRGDSLFHIFIYLLFIVTVCDYCAVTVTIKTFLSYLIFSMAFFPSTQESVVHSSVYCHSLLFLFFCTACVMSDTIMAHNCVTHDAACRSLFLNNFFYRSCCQNNSSQQP